MRRYTLCALSLLVVFSTISPSHAKIEASSSTNVTSIQRNSLKIVALGSIALIASYISKRLYEMYQAYKETKLVDTCVDAIITLGTQTRNLAEEEKESVLRKKAYYILIRKEFLKKLELEANNPALSPIHKKRLTRLIIKLKIFFKIIDAVRLNNPYEQDYVTPNYLDKLIVKNIVSSFLLKTKPNNECSNAELAEKKDSARLRMLILQRLKGHITEYLFSQIEDLLL